MQEDSQHIKTMLVSNGFQEYFLGDCVRIFKNRLYKLLTLFHKRQGL